MVGLNNDQQSMASSYLLQLNPEYLLQQLYADFVASLILLQWHLGYLAFSAATSLISLTLFAVLWLLFEPVQISTPVVPVLPTSNHLVPTSSKDYATSSDAVVATL